jgi:DNA-directed RNA polymerase II subunit RPB2
MSSLSNSSIDPDKVNLSELSEDDIWNVIYSYFQDDKKAKNYYLTNHHLDSYNDFVLNKIPQTFKENNPQTIFLGRDEETKKYRYELDIYYGGLDSNKIYIGKPIIFHKETNKKQLFPNEARLKNLNYASHLFCDIDVVVRTKDTRKIKDELEMMKADKSIIEESLYEKSLMEKQNEGKSKDIISFENVSLGLLPIMLHSKICVLFNNTFETLKNMGECPYEQGGYFIIEGKEKVIVSHERKAENKLYVQAVKDDYYSHTVNIKSVPQGKFKYPKTTEISIKINTNCLEVRLPSFNRRIPLFVIFRALGFESDKEILEIIFGDLDLIENKELLNELVESVKAGSILYNQISAIKYLKQFTQGQTVSEAINIINNELIPHIGLDYVNKAYFLGHMVKKLIYNKKGLIRDTDRDSFAFKRVDLSGFLLAGLFRDNFIQFQRNAKIEIDREFRFNTAKYKTDINDIINESNLRIVFNIDKMEKPMMNAFKLGTILNKKGLIQSLSRRSFSDIISHTRRINTPSDLVMIGQRKLHSTQYGIICPVEAPDGGNVGIKKHMTIMTSITFGCDTKPIEKCLREFGMIYLDELTPSDIKKNSKVFLNGNYLGIHNNPLYLVKVLRLFRRNSIINIFTSVFWNMRFNEIYISTDGGRCCRPLAVVHDNRILLNKKHISDLKEKKITWKHLVSGFGTEEDKLDYYNCNYNCVEDKKNLIEKLEKNQSVLEYIDVDELDNCLIATSIEQMESTPLTRAKYTHCELHPSMILGPLGFICPFSNNSQSIRNVFGAGQGKQAVGVYTSNYRNRMDSGVHILNYPQKPLVNTRMSEYIFNSKLPCGMNTIVAIASYSGYNQEDSVLINKASLQKGCFISSYYKVYEADERIDKKKGTSEYFYSPEFDSKNVSLHKEYNYSKLDEYGIIKENEYVYQNDVLIGKYSEGMEGLSDISSAVKKDAGGLVDKVFMFNTNSDNNKMCKVRLCTSRVPELGDKFASRHGQKGTIGMLINGEDMPYSKDGITPDIIVNPHAFPSRMTIGQFLETIGGKIGSNLGFFFDGTPFENQSITELGDILQSECGYEKYGTEILYNGRTGRQLSTEIFIGPTYYQRLKQMVQDKINSRAPGAINYLTKQPPAGRAAGGGLRLGEMERDVVLAHGVSSFLKETTMERSDKYCCYVSDHTGEIAAVNPEKNIYYSPHFDGPLQFEGETISELKLKVQDKKSHSFSKVHIPYSVKLLIQECEALGVSLRIITDKDTGEINVLENNKEVEENIE